MPEPSGTSAPKGQVIYIAGPYGHSDPGIRLARVKLMMAVGKKLIEMGHYPIIPLLTHYFEEHLVASHGRGLRWEKYIEWDLELLGRADALFFMGHSPGADIELAYAQDHGLPVYYDYEDVPVGPGGLPPPNRGFKVGRER